MTERVRLAVRAPADAFSGAGFTTLVEVTNTSGSPLVMTEPEAQVDPGRILALKDIQPDEKLGELEQRRKSLVKEIQMQVSRASYKLERASQPTSLKILSLIPVLNIFVLLAKDDTSVQGEAMKVHEWADVERLEKRFIDPLPPNSRIRALFEMDKEKLQECLNKIGERDSSSARDVRLEQQVTVAPGETEVFAFRYEAPRVVRRTVREAVYKVKYLDPSSNAAGAVSVTSTLQIIPSQLIVSAGAITGAAVGYVARLGLIGSPDGLLKGVLQFLGVILLAALVSAALARSPDSKKPITTEDALGGFVVGGLVGLYSAEILEWLRTLLPSSPST